MAPPTLSRMKTPVGLDSTMFQHARSLEDLTLNQAFDHVQKNMPENRRSGYYPPYFYMKPALLVSQEMKVDAQRYLNSLDH